MKVAAVYRLTAIATYILFIPRCLILLNTYDHTHTQERHAFVKSCREYCNKASKRNQKKKTVNHKNKTFLYQKLLDNIHRSVVTM